MLDESDGVLTNELSGRTINKIYRKGKILEIQCFDGHVINIMADNNGDIRFYSKSVKRVERGLVM